MVESSRLEGVAFLCLQRLNSRSNKLSSRLENGIGLGKREEPLVRERSLPSSLPWSLPLPGQAELTDEVSEQAKLPAVISRAVAMRTGARAFRSCCASLSFSVMITKKRSTPLGEIQGPVCVSITLGRRLYSHFHGAAGVKLRERWIDGSATSKLEPFLHKPQKRFGTPRVSIVNGSPRYRADGSPPAVMRRGARPTTRFKARACAGEAAQAV